MLGYIVNRLREPSSYAGIGLLLGMAGVHMSDADMAKYIQAATMLAGAVALFVPDPTKK